VSKIAPAGKLKILSGAPLLIFLYSTLHFPFAFAIFTAKRMSVANN
jgi:hypothetical protein